MIKGLWIAAIGAALVTAHSLVDETGAGQSRLGTFAGARMRLSLGGARREPVRAGLTFTGTRTLQPIGGPARTMLADGLEFGFSGRQHASWSLAGQPLSGVDHRRNMTTGGKIALIAGGVLLVGGIGFAIWAHHVLEAERYAD